MGDDAPDEVIDDALVDFLEEFATPTSLRGICAGAQDDEDEAPGGSCPTSLTPPRNLPLCDRVWPAARGYAESGRPGRRTLLPARRVKSS